MIKHKLINKGSIAHALISPTNDPNILLPVKVIIKDIKFDEYNPLYLVKVIKFYDNIYLLKKYFSNNKFVNGFGKKARNFWISDDLKTVQELENLIAKEDNRFYIVVDSIHTTRYKSDLEDMFNRIQDFLIMRNLSEIKEFSTRTFYTGKLSFDSHTEFFSRLKRMLIDKITDLQQSWDEFTKRL